MTPETITTLIVDDDAEIRRLIRLLIELADDDLSVVGEAEDGLAAVVATETLHPGVIVLDIMMPGLDGLQAAERILAASPEQRIILFSASISDAQRARAQLLGISACMNKSDVTNVPELIRQVAAA